MEDSPLNPVGSLLIVSLVGRVHLTQQAAALCYRQCQLSNLYASLPRSAWWIRGSDKSRKAHKAHGLVRMDYAEMTDFEG